MVGKKQMSKTQAPVENVPVNSIRSSQGQGNPSTYQANLNLRQQTVALNALMARLKYGVGGLTQEVGSLAAGGMLWNVKR
jgi:hypothetical protein